MGAESDVGGGSGKTLQSHGQLPPGKMRIGCGVELVSARTESCWENVLPNVQRCQRVSSNQAQLIVVVKCSPWAGFSAKKLEFSYLLSPHLDRPPSRVYSPPTRFLPRKSPVRRSSAKEDL